jgi:hypothetical protein
MKKVKRKSKKILIPKKINSEIEKYPMVSCEWFDIVSDSSWSSFEQIKNSDLATCITKGHLLSQSKGITRIFGDYSLSEDKKKIETIGNTTLIPNSVDFLISWLSDDLDLAIENKETSSNYLINKLKSILKKLTKEQ